MAIFGRTEFLPPQQRDTLYELAGVRGFDGEFEKSIYIKGIETRDLAPGSPSAAFLESARLQQQVARSRPQHWAAVHATGFAEKGAFVVVDYYPRTAADLVKSGAMLNGGELHRIMMGVLKGLRDLQQISGRPHGNLKSSNILIGPGDLEEVEVALCDPAPANQLALGHAKNDLFQIGMLIHELVLHQPFSGAWPVAPTAAWSDLGSTGRRWRNLCNRLLNPNPEKRPRKLASVFNHVARLRPRRVRSLVPVAAVVVLLGLGALAFTQWDRISGFAKEHWPRREVAATNPSNGGSVPSRNGERPQQLAVVGATNDQSSAQPTATQPTTATLAAESTFLGEYQTLYEQRGWSAPAQYLANLRGRMAATASSDAAARKALGDTEATLKKIEERWVSLQETSNFLHQRAHNDPVLLTYPQFVRQSVAPVISGPATVSPLPALLEKLDALAADQPWGAVVAFLKGSDAQKLDHPWLIESSPLHQNFANKAIATRDDLQAWLAHAKSDQFAKLAPSEDPRSRWSARQQISRLRANDLGRLAGMYKEPAEAKAATAEFATKLEALDRSAAQVLENKLPWSMKNRPEIVEAISKLDRELASTAEQIRTAAAKRQTELDQEAARLAEMARQRQDAQQFALRLEAVKVSSHPAIQREWQSQAKIFMDEVRADASKYRPQMADQAARLQQRLEAVDAAVAAMPAKLELQAANGAPAWMPRLVSSLQSLDAKQRERILEDLLATARATSNREATVDEVKARAAQQRKNYDEWAAACARLLVDLAEADRLLAAGYSLDERPQRDRPSTRHILEHWQKYEFFGSELVQSAIAPLMTPVKAMERGDAQGLLQVAGAPEQRVGLRLAAWRNLAASDAAWPARQEDLKQALVVSESLAAAIARNVSDALRRDLQLTELSRTTAKVWARFVARTKEPADLDYAFSIREKLAIPTDLIDSRTRFNIALHDARRALAQASDEKTRAETIARVSGTLAGTIEALPKPQREAPEMARFAAALRQGRNASVAADFATLGPAAATARLGSPIKWNVTVDDSNAAVKYSATVDREITTDDLEIVFKRIATDSGDVYLSTTEVSVGLFGDVITAANKWRDVAPMLWSYDASDGDPRPGPRSWQWPRYGRLTAGIRTTTYWLTASDDHYPESLATAENRMVLRDENGRQSRELNPSKRQPMQYVSPQAAIYFSELLACRLPTPAEWKAAYRLHARDSWNLRDRTFKIFLRWTSRPALSDRFIPDLGVFVSPSEPPTLDVWVESKLMNRQPSANDREYDDRVLWFREVAPAGMSSFHHLVGNVAEMVYENGKLYAIGASALSPPSRPVDREIEIPNWRTGNKGYSDIGFRLAFPAPPNATQQLLALLEKQTYLAP